MSNKPANIWLPLYVGDYLSDTLHLTTTEHGAYLLLLMAYWKNGGAISSDKRGLSSICKLSISEFEEVAERVAEFFDLSDKSVWRQSRMDLEIEKWRNFKAGKQKGAEMTNAKRYAQRTLSGTPSPSPSPYNTTNPPTPQAIHIVGDEFKTYAQAIKDIFSFTPTSSKDEMRLWEWVQEFGKKTPDPAEVSKMEKRANALGWSLITPDGVLKNWDALKVAQKPKPKTVSGKEAFRC